METFIVWSRFDDTRMAEVAQRRPAHLAHVIDHREQIDFGGLAAAPAGPPQAILMVVRAESLDEARALVAQDPYDDLYASQELLPFQQRLPEPASGDLAAQLADALDGTHAP